MAPTRRFSCVVSGPDRLAIVLETRFSERIRNIVVSLYREEILAVPIQYGLCLESKANNMYV